MRNFTTREAESLESIIDGLSEIPRTERAWVAGFFDGEGCFYATSGKDGKNRCLYLSVSQSEISTLKRAQYALGGGGKIRASSTNYTAAKRPYALVICTKRDVSRAIYCILPYLSLPKLLQLGRTWDKVKESKSDGLTVLWPHIK